MRSSHSPDTSAEVYHEKSVRGGSERGWRLVNVLRKSDVTAVEEEDKDIEFRTYTDV